MSRPDVSLKVSASDEHLAAVTTSVRRIGVAGVKSDVLVEVARVAERTTTDGALERLVPGVRPDVDRESVATRVALPAERAHVLPVQRRPKTSC